MTEDGPEQQKRVSRKSDTLGSEPWPLVLEKCTRGEKEKGGGNTKCAMDDMNTVDSPSTKITVKKRDGAKPKQNEKKSRTTTKVEKELHGVDKFLNQFYTKRNSIMEMVDTTIRNAYNDEKNRGTMTAASELAYHDVFNAIFKPKFDI